MIGRWKTLEAVVVAVLAVIAFWYGRFAFLNTAAPPDYYWMAPAVMVATGQGFTMPIAAKPSALDDFLASRRPALEARDATPLQVSPLPSAEYATMRYLFLTLGHWWRITGMRWSALGDIAAALHVLAVLGVYATVRLFVPWPLALAGALWMCTSTLQLSLVPHVRDYSKGAFILAIIPLVLVIARARSRRVVIASCAAAGVLIGLGLGFRFDVLIMAPLTVACIVLFRGQRPWTDLAEKSLAIAALIGALILAGYPILSRLAGGSNALHVILLGYAEQFDVGLGIARPVYRVLPEYSDGYVQAAVYTRSERETGRWPRGVSAEYDAVGRRIWMDVLRNFPADALVRVLGATNTVLNLAFANPPPDGLFRRPLPGGHFLKGAYETLGRWKGAGIALGVILLVAAACSSLRLGLLTMFLLFALGGYPSLQFMSRHYFHLQIVPLLALLVPGWAVVTAPFRSHSRPWRETLFDVAILLGILALAVVPPLVILRAYQARHVDRLFSRFLASSRTRMDIESIQRHDDKWLVRWPGAAGRPSAVGDLSWAYYVVEFEGRGSELPAIALRYRSTPATAACTRTFVTPPDSGVARFGFEVFSSPGQQFEGVEVESRAKDRVLGVYRMDEDGPAGIPMELRLPSDWQRRHLYQRLLIEGAPDDTALDRTAGIALGSCE